MTGIDRSMIDRSNYFDDRRARDERDARSRGSVRRRGGDDARVDARANQVATRKKRARECASADGGGAFERRRQEFIESVRRDGWVLPGPPERRSVVRCGSANNCARRAGASVVRERRRSFVRSFVATSSLGVLFAARVASLSYYSTSPPHPIGRYQYLYTHDLTCSSCLSNAPLRFPQPAYTHKNPARGFRSASACASNW
eukprot:29442-Pelagococcus_subviridis.AAC.7